MELLQPQQRAAAGTEVVNSEQGPFAVEFVHDPVINALQAVALGQLQHQLLAARLAKPQGINIIEQLSLQEVAGGDVDADMKIGAVGEEINRTYRFSNHVAGQGRDLAVILRDRNKYVRRNAAQPRVLPAQQNFNAGAAAGAGVYLRLTKKLKFAADDPEVYLARETHAPRRTDPGDSGEQQRNQCDQRRLSRQPRQGKPGGAGGFHADAEGKPR